MTTTCLQPNVQYSLDVALRPFATFATYLQAENNPILSVLQDLVQAHDDARQYFLWGSVGTGKTHLLQAICNHVAVSQQNAIYLPLQEFILSGPACLKDIVGIDVLCIDDVDQVLGNSNWDQALFNLINEQRVANKSIVFTATKNPQDIKVSISDLASRLLWGPVFKLNILSDEQRQEAMQLHAEARGFSLSMEVSNYLIKRYPRELNSLIELIDILDQQSLAHQRKITLPFVKQVLENT